jgi:hypothetical protein
MVELQDMIDCESWYHLADYHYTGQDDLPIGIVHCDMGSIPEFFDKIRYNKEKYIVISSRCDFGLHYQAEFPPWQDYAKLAKQVLGPNNTNYGYSPVTLPAPINNVRCNPYHKYSIKCYRYTEATFDEIPENVVKWFVSNNTIHNDERIVTIPFGINGTDGNQEPKQKIYNKVQSINWNGDRDLDLYVNFQFYTNERYELYQFFSSCGSDKITCEKDIEFDKYIDQVTKHNCALCPCSNGWDSYRILETLYLGCIPIIEFNHGMYFYTKLNLPIFFVRDLHQVSEELLGLIRHSKISDRSTWNLSTVKLSYWKDIIFRTKELLL